MQCVKNQKIITSVIVMSFSSYFKERGVLNQPLSLILEQCYHLLRFYRTSNFNLGIIYVMCISSDVEKYVKNLGIIKVFSKLFYLCVQFRRNKFEKNCVSLLKGWEFSNP